MSENQLIAQNVLTLYFNLLFMPSGLALFMTPNVLHARELDANHYHNLSRYMKAGISTDEIAQS